MSSLLSLVAADQVRMYIGTGADGIYTSLFDQATGELSAATLAATIDKPTFLCARDGFLYSTTQKYMEDGGVAAYRVETTGELTMLNTAPTKGGNACHVDLDATGRHLLFANYSGENVGSIPLKSDGSLSEEIHLMPHEGASIHPNRQRKPHPHSIYAGPDNKFAYAPDLGTDQIWTYALDEQTGELKLIDKALHPAGGGPRHLKLSQDGKYAYVLSELTLDTVVYSRNRESGKLTQLKSFSNLMPTERKDGMTCSEIRIAPNEEYLYVANRDLENKQRDSLSVFAIRPMGELELIQVIPAEVWIPRNINFSPNARWLLVAGQRSNEVNVFEINSKDHKLIPTGYKISVPSPMCIESFK